MVGISVDVYAMVDIDANSGNDGRTNDDRTKDVVPTGLVAV